MEAVLGGILPAIASPCDERDTFLESQFASLANALYCDGVDGLYVCGGTGDGYRMRLEERKRAAEIAVECSREFRGTVVVHVGTSNSRDAMELAAHAAETDATAVSSMPPANCDHRQLMRYYTDIATAARIPVLVYHIPRLTHYTPTVDEMVELLDIDGVMGLKLSDWNLFFMKRLLLARPETIVFSGFDEFLCPALLYGAHGGIGMWYNLFPKLFTGIYQAVSKGRVGRAMELQNRLLSFCDLAWRYDLTAVFEFLMQQRGFGPYCRRRPRAVLDIETQKRIEPELNARIAAIEEVL